MGAVILGEPLGRPMQYDPSFKGKLGVAARSSRASHCRAARCSVEFTAGGGRAM